jgi:hypothetical protein
MKKIALAFAAAAIVAACTSAQGFVPNKITATDNAIFQSAMKRALKDPSSAEVDDLRVYQAPNGNRMICGKVNGRNSFGGYAGFQTLMVMQVTGADYSKPYIKPITALGGAGAIDCAGAGYPI